MAMGATVRQQSCPSPEEGVRALMDAAKHNDTTRLLQVLGPAAQPFINTGEPDTRRNDDVSREYAACRAPASCADLSDFG
jgi:Protein of unknown function (DUF2950)